METKKVTSDPLDMDVLMRARQVLRVLPISKSTWWAGVAKGRFPRPVKIGPKISAWRRRDILALLEQLSAKTDRPEERRGNS